MTDSICTEPNNYHHKFWAFVQKIKAIYIDVCCCRVIKEGKYKNFLLLSRLYCCHLNFTSSAFARGVYRQ